LYGAFFAKEYGNTTKDEQAANQGRVEGAQAYSLAMTQGLVIPANPCPDPSTCRVPVPYDGSDEIANGFKATGRSLGWVTDFLAQDIAARKLRYGTIQEIEQYAEDWSYVAQSSPELPAKVWRKLVGYRTGEGWGPFAILGTERGRMRLGTTGGVVLGVAGVAALAGPGIAIFAATKACPNEKQPCNQSNVIIGDVLVGLGVVIAGLCVVGAVGGLVHQAMAAPWLDQPDGMGRDPTQAQHDKDGGQRVQPVRAGWEGAHAGLGHHRILRRLLHTVGTR
jgi:hypothetical protein